MHKKVYRGNHEVSHSREYFCILLSRSIVKYHFELRTETYKQGAIIDAYEIRLNHSNYLFTYIKRR